MAPIGPDRLARALILWSGHGVASFPQWDRVAVTAALGEDEGREVLAELDRLVDIFYRSEAHITEPSISMVQAAITDFIRQVPETDSLTVDILAWCYSYDYK